MATARVLHLVLRADQQTQSQVLALAHALADQGVETEVLLARPGGTADGEPWTVSRDGGVTLTEYPWPGSPAELPAGLAAGLRAVLERVPGYDLLHAHDAALGPYLAATAHALHGTPFLTTVHGSGPGTDLVPGPAGGYGGALVTADPVVAARLTAALPSAAVRCVPYGIDQSPDALEDPAEPAAADLAGALVVAGDQDPRLLSGLAGHRIRAAAGLTGPQDVAGAALLLADGRAAAWIERAALHGVPVIAPAESATVGLLGADYPGLLPVGGLNPQSLAALAERLLGGDAPLQRLAEARKRVAEQRSWAAAAARYQDIYRAVRDGVRPPLDDTDRVPMALPDITGAEARAASDALYSAKLSAGPHVEAFEEEFAAYHGVPHAVAVNSAAAALFASLVCAGITGEVLVPSFTWAATANAVVAAGATPVWVDIEGDTLALGPEAVAAAIGPRTEAVMPVHYAGHPARVAELAELCAKRGLLLVEDAAEATGARQNGGVVGSFGVGCFSFYGTKNMTTGGEGGMVTTTDAALAAGIRRLRAHGMRPVPDSPYPWKKEAVTAGFNFRMPEPLAAVGRRQLERLDRMNDARHAVAEVYDAALEAALGDLVRPHHELPGFRHVYHMYVVRLRDSGIRDEVVARLRSLGVEASVHFDPPVHQHVFYRDRFRQPDGGLPVTDAVAGSVVTLPLSTGMSRQTAHRVVAELTRVLGEFGVGPGR